MSTFPWKSASLVLAGIVLGCGAGAVGGAVAQQEPGPPPAGDIIRYEYTCKIKQESRMWEADALAMVNKMGSAGWRLLDRPAVSDVYCFERAVR
jgi:hypothetical protein